MTPGTDARRRHMPPDTSSSRLVHQSFVHFKSNYASCSYGLHAKGRRLIRKWRALKARPVSQLVMLIIIASILFFDNWSVVIMHIASLLYI